MGVGRGCEAGSSALQLAVCSFHTGVGLLRHGEQMLRLKFVFCADHVGINCLLQCKDFFALESSAGVGEVGLIWIGHFGRR